jgi:hypothetical protein
MISVYAFVLLFVDIIMGEPVTEIKHVMVALINRQDHGLRFARTDIYGATQPILPTQCNVSMMRNRNAMPQHKVDNNEAQKCATCRQQIARSHPHHAALLRATMYTTFSSCIKVHEFD